MISKELVSFTLNKIICFGRYWEDQSFSGRKQNYLTTGFLNLSTIDVLASEFFLVGGRPVLYIAGCLAASLDSTNQNSVVPCAPGVTGKNGIETAGDPMEDKNCSELRPFLLTL